MMRNMLRRIAALMLCAIMLLSIVPLGVAEDGLVVDAQVDAKTTVEEVASSVTTTDDVTNQLNIDSTDDSSNVDVKSTDVAIGTINYSQPIVILGAQNSSNAIGEDTTETYKITFDLNGGTQVTPNVLEVLIGEKIKELPIPVYLDTAEGDLTKHKMQFSGWYLNAEGTGDKVTIDTNITSSLTLFAKWDEIDVTNSHYLNYIYKNETLAEVKTTYVVSEDHILKPYSNMPVIADMTFVGWSKRQQSTLSYTEYDRYKFSFNTTISPESIKVDEKYTLSLYAWYAKTRTVQFVPNGGLSIPPVILYEGELLQQPIVVREGYTLEGWYTSQEFDPLTKVTFTNGGHAQITASCTLYAKWTAQKVAVKLVYMYENANDDDYSPAARDATTVYAPAGSYVSINKTDSISNLSASHSVKYVSADRLTSGDATTTANNTIAATIQDVSEYLYQYDHFSEDPSFVKPDGSTIILIYYNRALITLTFTYRIRNEDKNDDVATDDGNIVPDTQHQRPGGTNTSGRAKIDDDKLAELRSSGYNADSTANNTATNPIHFTYKFTAKYGQDISAVWLRSGWVENNSDEITYKYDKGASDQIGTFAYTFTGWMTPAGVAQVGNMYVLDKTLFVTGTENSPVYHTTIFENKLVASGQLYAVASPSSDMLWMIYAVEALSGTTGDFETQRQDGTVLKSYIIDHTQIVRQTGHFGSKGMGDGFIALPYNVPFGRNTRSLTDSKVGPFTNAGTDEYVTPTSNNTTFEGKFLNVFADELNGQEEFPNTDTQQIHLYKRNNFVLKLVSNDGTQQEYVKSLQYQAPLMEEIIASEKTLSKDDYTFVGWYTSSDFNEGSKFEVSDKSIMPNANMTLHGKWESTKFHVVYYYSTQSDQMFKEPFGVTENAYLTDYEMDKAYKDNFDCWGWYPPNSNTLIRFDFAIPVGRLFTDDSDTLKLYGMWKETDATVTYDPGSQGKNALVVTDETKYKTGTGVFELPDYKTKWPDGVPVDEDYVFVGWKAPNDKIYQPGEELVVLSSQMTFVAQWEECKNAFQIIYDGNGGMGNNDPTIKTYSFALTGSGEYKDTPIWDNELQFKQYFTFAGYELMGWSKLPEGPVDYKIGEGTIRLEKGKPTTLYAIWKPTTVAITIKKVVTGGFGDVDKAFSFNATVTPKNGVSTTVEFTLKNGDEGHLLKDVPIGSKLVIEETGAGDYELSVTATGIVEGSLSGFVYTVSEVKKSKVDDDILITFTNNKEATIDTGVLLDSLPYILILGAAVAGIVIFLLRKRRRDDEE